MLSYGDLRGVRNDEEKKKVHEQPTTIFYTTNGKPRSERIAVIQVKTS